MREIHYDEAKVPPYALPDPLRFADGSPVAAPDGWWRRRTEILRAFEQHVYGRTPVFPQPPSFEVVEERGDALDGRAWRRQVRITVPVPPRALSMDLLLHLPSAPARPCPLFLGLNFGGNHSVVSDPDVRLPRSWVGGAASIDGRATEAGRGRDTGSWPLEAILARGYGLATLYCGDVEPDRPDGFTEGARGLLTPDGPGGEADAWGALGAWAWGLSRVMDYLEGLERVDRERVAVMGHSRLGKAALWAGAQDERFALVISNNSGCGGAALSRRQFGETVARINTSFPHWFCPGFRRYNDREDELPVDQHMLIALVAPRPVYIASAEADRWADPRGEFLAARGADPVYRLLCGEGLAAEEWPAVNRPVQSRIGYHLRPGGHGVTLYDWERFMDFADRLR